MSTNLPPLPPSGDDWPPRQPRDLASYTDLQLVIRLRRTLEEAYELGGELERRVRDGGDPR